jgi:ACS family glucarate transporter-like MFS transporter
MFAGIGVGSAVTPPFVAWIVLNWGWRSSFYVSAAIGFVLAVFFHLGMPDDPNQTRDTAKAEALLATPWRQIFRSREVWLLVISIFFFGYVTYVFFFWFYPYLVEVRKISLLRSSFFTAIPFIAMALSAPLGGKLSDGLINSLGKSVSRRRVAMGGLFYSIHILPLLVYP